jgi:hypothetical protein
MARFSDTVSKRREKRWTCGSKSRLPQVTDVVWVPACTPLRWRQLGLAVTASRSGAGHVENSG